MSLSKIAMPAALTWLVCATSYAGVERDPAAALISAAAQGGVLPHQPSVPREQSLERSSES